MCGQPLFQCVDVLIVSCRSRRMEFKYNFKIHFTKYVFNCWWTLGRLFGLLPIEFDKNLNKYVKTYPSLFYTMCIGAIILFYYPMASQQFLIATNFHWSIKMLEDIAIINQVIPYLYLMGVYFIFSLRSQKLIDLVNDVKTFCECFQKTSPNIHESSTKYEIFFMLCFAQRVFKSLQFFTATFYVVDMSRFSLIETFFIIIPELTSAVVYTQFFLGILFFWRCATIIKMKIEVLRKRENFQYLHNDLILSDNFDELAICYDQLYKIYKKFKDFYGNIMITMLLYIFQYLTMMTFYLILWMIDFLYGLMKIVAFELIFVNLFVIVTIFFEIFIFCQVSTSCMIEVCSTN